MTSTFDLLSRGYFPRELPPSFQTTGFATFVQEQSGGIAGVPFDTQRNAAELSQHSLARAGALRRELSIPHPLFQALLANEIATNWNLIEAQTAQASLSLTRPTPTPFARSLEPACQLAERASARVRCRAGRQFVVRADIAQFYHSVYTHSIPWAFHTKPVAKQIHGSELFGNRIDRCQRNAQHRQTVGVPIGPDTSLAIAESILAPVDRALLAAFPRVKGFRYLDDYELCCTSHREAEDVLAWLQQGLGELELHLNDRKTSIVDLPAPFEEPWIPALRDFQLDSSTPRRQASGLIQFFDLAFAAAAEHPTEHVLRYALGRLRNLALDEANVERAQHLVLSAALAESGTLPHCVATLFDYKMSGEPLLLDVVQETLNLIIEKHAASGHGSEVAWGLFGAIVLEVRVGSAARQRLQRLEDDVVALVALSANRAGLFEDELDVSLWSSLLTPDQLYGRHWLLAYEAVSAGLLETSDSSFFTDPFFQALHAANVRFVGSPPPNQPILLLSPGVAPTMGAGGGGGGDY